MLYYSLDKNRSYIDESFFSINHYEKVSYTCIYIFHFRSFFFFNSMLLLRVVFKYYHKLIIYFNGHILDTIG